MKRLFPNLSPLLLGFLACTPALSPAGQVHPPVPVRVVLADTTGASHSHPPATSPAGPAHPASTATPPDSAARAASPPDTAGTLADSSASASTSVSELTIASFNIRVFSNNSRTDQELGKIADRLQQFDLVAIQELRDTIVVARTLALLSSRGQSFKAEVSKPVGRGSSRERYAFFYRPNRVTVLHRGNIFPDPQDHFIREPYVASFKAGNFDFTLITIHLLFGASEAARRPEALRLDDVYDEVQAGDPQEQDVILTGDFNLFPDDPGFDELRRALTPLFAGAVRTTITDTSLYDNLWFDGDYVREFAGKSGVDRYDETAFGGDDKAASLAVSDHRPAWAKFRVSGPDDD